MPKLFTDSEGRQWEEVPKLANYSSVESRIIRPVKKVKKVDWTLALYAVGEFDLFRENYQLTEDQAQLIKACVQDLMDLLMDGRPDATVDHIPLGSTSLQNSVDKARHSIKGGE